MESRLWMPPTLILTFYGWGTGPQEIRLRFQGHGELHNHEENASVVPKFIYVPSRWLKKNDLYWELSEGGKKKQHDLKVLDLYFFQQNTPTREPLVS